jgi:hypothetical protein
LKGEGIFFVCSESVERRKPKITFSPKLPLGRVGIFLTARPAGIKSSIEQLEAQCTASASAAAGIAPASNI